MHAAFGIAPDFTFLSANFLYLTGSVRFDPSFSQVNYTSAAWDGIHAINASGQQIDATPTNFAGQTGAIPEPGMAAMLLISLGMLRRR